MPLFLARGGVSLRLAPHEVFRRTHGHDCDTPPKGFGSLVRGISEDVEELREVHNLDCAVGAPHVHYASTISEDKRRLASAHVHEHLHEALELIRGLDGEVGHAHVPIGEAMEILERLIDADLPVQLLAELPHLEFEARKDVMNVCSTLLRAGLPKQVDRRVESYLRDHPTFFSILIKGYCAEELSLHSGVILRSCARHEELVEAFLDSGKLFDIIGFAHSPSIEVSSDAFCTLREMLMKHKELAAGWLEDNFKQFFSLFNRLLTSGNYCVERQAQKLLVDVFLDKQRFFQRVMLKYVSSADHLVINMNLLKDSSRALQADAFQLFKLFVGNPHKPPKAQQILFKNKAKIAALLASFPSLKPDDAKFGEEVKVTIKKVNELAAPIALEDGTKKRAQTWHAAPTRELTSPTSPGFCPSKIFQGHHWTPQVQRVRADSADSIESDVF